MDESCWLFIRASDQGISSSPAVELEQLKGGYMERKKKEVEIGQHIKAKGVDRLRGSTLNLTPPTMHEEKPP